MRSLVRAELRKLWSTRTTTTLLTATLALVVLTISLTTAESDQAGAPLRLDDPRVVAVVVGVGFGVPLVLMVLLGAVSFTQEVRYGTATVTYLVEPRRHRVLLAKWLSLTLVSTVVTTVTLLVATPLCVALVRSRGGVVSLGDQFWQMVAAGYVVMAVYAVVGVALGALVRNQVTVVVGVLVWMLGVEQVVVPSYPSVGRWMPFATSSSLMQLGASVDPQGKLLSVVAAGALLAAYASAAALLAVRVSPRRDVH